MTRRSGIQLCYPFEEKRLAKWGYPVIIQPKLDGVRCRVIMKNGEISLLSSEERLIESVPHINQFFYEKGLAQSGLELDGELYYHGRSFEDISSITSRTKNIHDEYHNIQFHLFDLVDESMAQSERLMCLWDLSDHYRLQPANFLEGSPIRHVPTRLAQSFEELWDYYQYFLEQKYEGIIVRHPQAPYIRRRSIYMMKFKPKKDDWYTVIGSYEETSINGEPKGRLGSIECVGSTGGIFTVGSGLTDEQRRKYWEVDLRGWLCHVQYQHITPGKGVPRFPVFMELINPEEVMG